MSQERCTLHACYGLTNNCYVRTENSVDPSSVICHAKGCDQVATRVCKRGSCEFGFCSESCIDTAKRGTHGPHCGVLHPDIPEELLASRYLQNQKKKKKKKKNKKKKEKPASIELKKEESVRYHVHTPISITYL